MAKRILILTAFVFVVFSPCLKAGFINFDDDGHILNNPVLRQDLSFSSVRQIFRQDLNKTYVPLSILTFAVEKYFFGFNPFVFHLDNLLIYAGTVILVLLLAQRMGLSMEAGFFAALIFAIHPMRVESVVWASERKDVLCAFFYILALYQYLAYLKSLSFKHYSTAILFGFLSILAKPMAVSLPLILLLFDWYYGRRFNKRVLIEKIPVFIYIFIVAWITYSLNIRNPLGNVAHNGIFIWIWSLCFYLWKFIFPFQVHPYYALPYPVSILHWPYLLSVLFFLGLIFALVRFQKHKLFIFALFYFFFSLFFLFRFDDKEITVVADRYMFLPSLGICLFIGSWADQRIKSKAGVIIFYLILVLMALKSNLQSRIWHDSVSFWSEVIRDYPNYYRAYNNRGLAESDDLAFKDFSRAIALNPGVSKSYNNRGIIYYLKGDDIRALEDFNRAISIEPTFPAPYLNRSKIEEAHKDYKQAFQDALYAKKLRGQ